MAYRFGQPGITPREGVAEAPVTIEFVAPPTELEVRDQPKRTVEAAGGLQLECTAYTAAETSWRIQL